MTKKRANHRHRVESHIEKTLKAIARDIAATLKKQELTQTAASHLTGEAPSQISLVCTGKLKGFSMERLLRMRAMLGGKIVVKFGDQTVSIG